MLSVLRPHFLWLWSREPGEGDLKTTRCPKKCSRVGCTVCPGTFWFIPFVLVAHLVKRVPGLDFKG